MSQTAPPRSSSSPGRRPEGRRTGAAGGTTAAGTTLAELVGTWVSEGIVTPEQGRRIIERSAGARLAGAPQPRVGPIMLEGLGYLGGVVVVAGCILLASLYWSDLSHWTQVVVLAVTAMALVGAGAAVPRRLGGVAVRLRSVLWAAGTAAFGAALGVYATDLLPAGAEDHAGVLITGGSAVLAAALWWLHRVLLQQVAMMALLAATAAMLVADVGSDQNWPGVAVWAVGLVWFALGWTGLLRPPRAARAFGAAAAIFGTLLTTDADAGMALMLATTVAVVALALFTRDLALLVVGAIGLLQGIPSAVNRWFPNSLVAALALLVVGGGLVGAAIWIARRHDSHPTTARRAHDH